MELLTHNCLLYRFQSFGQIASWVFAVSGGSYPVEARGSLIANCSPVTIELAVQGLGIAYAFRDYCTDLLARGDLVEVLTEHQVTMPSVNIYFPREYRKMTPLNLFSNT